jgi:Sugar-transfer associated ATP-grasp
MKTTLAMIATLKYIAWTIVQLYVALIVGVCTLCATLVQQCLFDRDTVLLSLFYRYYGTLAFYWLQNGTFENEKLNGANRRARVHLYSLALELYLCDRAHYRSGTFRRDSLKNLRNVAVPGTGVPLSLYCMNRYTIALYILVANPLICWLAALHEATRNVAWQQLCVSLMRDNETRRRLAERVARAFEAQLLMPDDWFSYWRLNCRLASFHAMHAREPRDVDGYAMEDKWHFLQSAKRAGVAVSPWLDIDAGAIVVKDKNEEGGMGVHVYESATHGGNWIVQQRLYNRADVAALLPDDAPLSTLRVMSTAAAILSGDGDGVEYEAVSCVFRAGRSGARTDHQSILFDVDIGTGDIGLGTTNEHWYRLGVREALRTPWTSTHDITAHPDTGVTLSGQRIAHMDQVRELVTRAHRTLLPTVPIAGWDVAFTERHGLLLLEVNLSCNFFRATFDRERYFDVMHHYFTQLDHKRFD